MPETRTVKGFSEDGLPLAEEDFECCTFDHSDNSPCPNFILQLFLSFSTATFLGIPEVFRK